MGNSVYLINKGVNRPIEFKGLKAQFIWWLGGGLLLLLVLYAILYLCGVNSYVCVAVIGAVGFSLFYGVYKVNNKYGEFGIMKTMARRRVPKVLKARSRKIFFQAKKG